jgi:hypothetical protein
MSNYTKLTDFASKDSLPSGNAAKIVKGTEIDDEFEAIETAIATKANIDSPALSGTPTAPTATAGTNTTQIATTAFATTAATNAANTAVSGINVTSTTVTLDTNWVIEASGTKLTFKYSGTAVGSLDSSGNFIALGNVTAYGTP